MNENERYNIDEIFRTKIEKMSLRPPTTNLSDVRANILQRNLQSSQFQNQWLKGSLIAMTFLLGTCFYLLLNKRTAPEDKILVEKVYLRDTLYVTKYRTKYLKIPVLIYPKSQDENVAFAKIIQPNEIINDKTFTKELNKNNITDSFINSDKTTDLGKKNNIKESGSVDNQLLAKEEIGSIDIENPDDVTIKKAGITAQSLRDNFPKKLSDISMTYDLLKSKKLHSEIIWKTPLLKFKSPIKIKFKEPKVVIPFMDRLSMGIYVSPENNIVDVRKDAIQAFGLGDEEISGSSNIGLRLGFKLSKKVSLATGVELQTMNFSHQGIGKESVTAESGKDGNPTFLRYTIFGVAKIPTTKMTTSPQVGSTVLIEGDDGHFTEAIRIPISLKLQFYERNLHGFGWRGAGLNLYAIGGGYYAIKNKQQLMLEIYEPDGHDFYEVVNNFNNTQSYMGLNFGFGAEFSYGRNFQLFTEPYYQTTLTSLVKDMPIRTFVNGIGLKVGINYQFSKR